MGRGRDGGTLSQDVQDGRAQHRGYNGRVREALDKGELFKRTVQTGFDEDTGEPVFETEEFQPETFPYIVVIVDEMAD